MFYSKVVEYVTRHPWAILSSKLDAIASMIQLRANGLNFTKEEITARIGDGSHARDPLYSAEGVRAAFVKGKLAIIPVFGVMAYRANMLNEISGGTSTEILRNHVKRFAEDDSVGTIILDIDSEGGVVEGVPELWRSIFEARQRKKVIAVANATAASAAYWIATAASEVVVVPSGSVGSIGVLHIHADRSTQLEEDGINITITQAGRFKGEGNPLEPLTKEAKIYIQKRVDGAYADFVADVARGRGSSRSTVRDTFGEGRMVTAKEALNLGMVDRIGTLDEVISRSIGGKRGRRMVAIGSSNGVWSVEEDGVEMLTGKVDLSDEADHPFSEMSGVDRILMNGVIPLGLCVDVEKDLTATLAEEDGRDIAAYFGGNERSWEELNADEQRSIAGHFLWCPKMPPDDVSQLIGLHHRPSDGLVVFEALERTTKELIRTNDSPDKEILKGHLRDHYRAFGMDEPAELKPAVGSVAEAMDCEEFGRRKDRALSRVDRT